MGIQSNTGRFDRSSILPAHYEFNLVQARARWNFSAGLIHDLNELSRHEGVTLATTLLAGFQVLMTRYMGHDDTGAVSLGGKGKRFEVEYLTGFRVNRLRLRTDCSGEMSVRSLLERVGGGSPSGSMILDDPLTRAPTVGIAMAECDLNLSFWEESGLVVGAVDYSTAAIERLTVERVIESYQVLLQAMANDPGQRIDDLPMLSRSQRYQLLEEFNATAAEYPAHKLIHQLFEEQVHRAPNAIALVCEDQYLTYAQLNRRANQLAHHLISLGVRADDCVAVCMSRSLDMVVGLMGILKAGGAYVPLDPGYPAARLACMLEDSAPVAVVTQHAFRERLPPVGVPVIVSDSKCGLTEIERQATHDPDPATLGSTAHSLAYVMYTSGSTGRPKGVMNQHGAVANRLWWAKTEYGLQSDDRVLQKTPFGFDVSVWEFFLPLLAGARVVLARPGGHQEPHYLIDLIERMGITILHFVPSMLNLFLNEARSGGCHTLRHVLCSGEALPYSLQVRWQARFPHAELHNLYGPTEAAIDVTAWRCAAGHHPGIVPIGRPISNTQIYILDSRRALVPIGVSGEIYIAGVGLARGYVGRPELTAERFVRNPFNSDKSARMYKTGDLGRWLPDGNVEFLGRNDFQVKLRGNRVELGEIEAQLCAFDGVREAAVSHRMDPGGDWRLIAYITPSPSLAAPILNLLRMNKAGLGLTNKKCDLPNGLTVFHQNTSETAFLYQEIFNNESYLRHGVVLRDGDCIVDVGANIGMFSLFVAQRCRNATIFAFEPIPPIYKSLQLNAALYGLKGEVFEFGLSDRCGEECFSFYPHNTLISSSRITGDEVRDVVKSFLLTEPLAHEALHDQVAVDELLDARLDAKKFRCPLRTLSQVMEENEIERINLLKIDVENAEESVLDGIDEKDWLKIEQLVIEVHDIAGRLLRMSAKLESHGFAIGCDQQAALQGSQIYSLSAVRASGVSRCSTSKHAAAASNATYTWASQAQWIRAVRTHLLHQLPDYMIPRDIVVIESLPLTGSGKLDRSALPAPDNHSIASPLCEAPTGKTEIAIAQIWQKLLTIGPPGRQDDFFELGGHSLSAVQLCSRLRQVFGVDVALRQVFAEPKLLDLARGVLRANRAERSGIVPVERNAPLCLSWGQRRLWFLDQLDPAASASYHIAIGFRLQGSLDVAALRRALNALVGRHESLRTTFASANGEPSQKIANAGDGFLLIEHDVSYLSGADRQSLIDHLRQIEAAQPFDLAAGPLSRGRLLRARRDEHILLITQHHIVSDAWSIGILLRELSTLYDAFRQGSPNPLPTMGIQYADYSAWQRTWIQGAALQEQVDYWTAQLAGAPALLEMPTSRGRTAAQSYRGGTVRCELSPLLTAALLQKGARHGTTLFMTLLAGWSILLSRFSGQSDIVIGTPVAVRQRAEIEPVVGFFINTLALRVRLGDNPNVADFLKRVRTVTIDGYANQDVPFEQVVEALRPARSLSYSPIFQAMLSLNNAPEDATLRLSELTVCSLERHGTTAQFDLSLALSHIGETIVGDLEYASDLFERSTAERMVEHLKVILEGMVRDDEQLIGRLPLLSPSQREQILIQFNGGSVGDVDHRLLHKTFEQHVDRDPDAVAVVYGDRHLSYAQLNIKANQLAHRLIELGVRPGALVGICIDRSLEMIVGVLGVLKAGGAYVPLDPAYPAERLAYMLNDSAPIAVVTQRAMHDAVRALQLPVVALDLQNQEPSVSGQSESNPSVADLGPGALAYVVYTSGSTGRPKGVMVEHRNVTRLFSEVEKWFHFDQEDVWSQCHSLSFDFSVWEIWGALLHGGRLIIVPLTTVRAPDVLYELLCQERVTILNQTPSAFSGLMAAQAESARVHGLRRVIFGGEALEAAKLKPWYVDRRNHRCELINMYGITETTVHVTYRLLEEADTDRWGGSLIGRPIGDLRIYILDGYRQPVPVGMIGELYIGGAGVSRGYLNRPELTAERFVRDMFSADNTARMYKSGDLGRWLPDGDIEYLGRNDSQVKIRGYRIELGEIEARLLACDEVREAAVIACEDTSKRTQLVAYVTARNGTLLEPSKLRAQLSNVLSEYMIPSAFVTLTALPLTPNGKLDRKALPAPVSAPISASAAFAAMTSEASLELATVMAIVEELLPGVDLGLEDNLFHYGLHSISLLRFVSRCRDCLGVRIPVRDVYRYATPLAIARALEAARDLQ